MRIPVPPRNCKEHGPYGTKQMIGQEYMRKVERSLGVFLQGNQW